jgi:uncharacterized protein
VEVERAIRPDPRSPYVLDTRELGRRPGTMKMVRRTVPGRVGFGVEMAGVPEGVDVELDLRLESVMEGVLVTGSVRALATGECGRCLGDFSFELDTDLTELFVYPDRDRSGPDRDGSGENDDVRELKDELIDLEPAVRDTVVLSLPFQPVCRDDCPGLCSECGARLADDPGHRHEAADPRWAALEGFVNGTVPDGAPKPGVTDDEREK